MQTWHIHIRGLVQGVGFRPYTCRLATAMNVAGTVVNGTDGVHIHINATEEEAFLFYEELTTHPPANAILRSSSCVQVSSQQFQGFHILDSSPGVDKPDLLLSPDIAICPECLREINDPGNHRYQYAFTTCLECGPRYSILSGLPYDRCNTTMSDLPLCDNCKEEYHSVNGHRHYSQTNSCPACSIPMHLFNSDGEEISRDPGCIPDLVQKALADGDIVAVKGIGGYLLLCDATHHSSIRILRERKKRPSKPFAVLYPSLASLEEDLFVCDKERSALQSKAAPIVLCKPKPSLPSGLCRQLIAPGLDRIGAMLPYTALLSLVASAFGKPLVATSGNISGAPIIYTDEDALLWLGDQADAVLSFDRDIMAPQDDSVMQFTQNTKQRIILRRSRGLAPNYYPPPFKVNRRILATGADMKSAFGIADRDNIYISQYLGDQTGYDAQLSYQHTLRHLSGLLQFRPQHIVIDRHPDYATSQLGHKAGRELGVPVTTVQHHHAHFCSVLAENELMDETEKILGVVWDGTGYGDDRQIWGGEFFTWQNGNIERFCHLDYFPHLLGDRMSREPRLSALSILNGETSLIPLLERLFSYEEWHYLLKLLNQEPQLLTSSAGRLIDAVAALLKIQYSNTYEGEAAMKLEAMARQAPDASFDHYAIGMEGDRLRWQPMIRGIYTDMVSGKPIASIARKVFVSLAIAIRKVALATGVKKVTFSGGVFQNGFLVDLVTGLMQDDFDLYFHRQLSPNDECIAMGQLAWLHYQLKSQNLASQTYRTLTH